MTFRSPSRAVLSSLWCCVCWIVLPLFVLRSPTTSAFVTHRPESIIRYPAHCIRIGYSVSSPQSRCFRGFWSWTQLKNNVDGKDLPADEKSTIRSSGQNTEQHQPFIASQVRRSLAYFFPEIPFQDTSRLSWRDQFRRNFIAREAILGARTMMRVYCLLFVIGVVFHQCCILLPNLPSTVALSDYEFLHFVDVYAKHSLDQVLVIPPLLQYTIVSPVLEEFSYRGLGFLLMFGSRWAFYYLVGSLFAVSPILAAGFLIYDVVTNRWRELLLAMQLLDRPLLERIRYTGRSLELLLLQVPFQLRLFRWTRRRHDDGTTQRDDRSLPRRFHIQEEKEDGKYIPSLCRSLCERVTDGVMGRNSTVSMADRHQFTYQLYRLLSRHARLQTSMAFAYAHIPRRQSMESSEQYAYLQKFLGVTGSSFLIESRLVIRRGNIWGACGAHMAFNTMAIYRICLGEVLPQTGVFAVAVFPLVVVLSQVTLDWLGTKLKGCEDLLDARIRHSRT